MFKPDGLVHYKKLVEKENLEHQNIKGNINLNHCIEAFSEEELLTGNNQVYCKNCKSHQDCYKKMDIYNLPNILVV